MLTFHPLVLCHDTLPGIPHLFRPRDQSALGAHLHEYSWSLKNPACFFGRALENNFEGQTAAATDLHFLWKIAKTFIGSKFCMTDALILGN